MKRERYWQSVRFFRDHAGFSVQPDESTAQGKLRCARALARAEAWAREENITFAWESDWGLGSHVQEFGDSYDEEPTTCEVAIARDADGQVVASLGCIDDADANYRRVVNAELAYEAMPA